MRINAQASAVRDGAAGKRGIDVLQIQSIIDPGELREVDAGDRYAAMRGAPHVGPKSVDIKGRVEVVQRQT